jgi:hypothetical protein
MVSEDRSDWRKLCKQAASETDFTRLLELTAEIIRLLDEQRVKPGCPLPSSLAHHNQELYTTP